jgi:uncharacterized protein YbjT (DUF2867 family)
MAKKVLLTGATGFIGRRLLTRLLEKGHQVRAVSRRPPAALDLPAHPNLELYQGDALDASALPEMLEGMDAAFYLIHSMEGGVGNEDLFVERDRQAALNFSRAAKQANLSQVIYLSGLEPKEEVSKHLRSRNDVEIYLGEHGVPVTVLRAGFIIGPGSAGFSMLQGIVGQMRTMMISRELHHKTQPAFVEDVVEALATCLEHPEVTAGETFELGSKEVVEYFDIVRDFCACAGREVNFIEVPWVPQKIAATYIASVSGLPFALVAALAEGLNIDLFVENERLYELFPHIHRTSPAEAMRFAFREITAAAE